MTKPQNPGFGIPMPREEFVKTFGTDGEREKLEQEARRAALLSNEQRLMEGYAGFVLGGLITDNSYEPGSHEELVADAWDIAECMILERRRRFDLPDPTSADAPRKGKKK